MRLRAETDAAKELGEVAVTRKLELVGKSTARILLTAEKESAPLRPPTSLLWRDGWRSLVVSRAHTIHVLTVRAKARRKEEATPPTICAMSKCRIG
jgi:hypothetical protein